MKIEQYLRNEFAKHLRPLLIKDECEICGTDKKLEVHHERQFIDTLN
ncbi:MAG: hypothetical protein LIR50_05565 [Bacillota bacterium]|nr:hypothetical protein [Bacillota bacterium]